MLNYSIIKRKNTQEIILENGIIKVIIVPEQGGRILEFSTENLNVLYRNANLIGIKGDVKADYIPENWLNFGGYKGWPAPQTKWAWPPMFDIDLNVFEYDIIKLENSLIVTLRSPIPNTLGLKFIRKIVFEDKCNHITIKETIVNLNKEAVEWAVWGNTQALSPGCIDIKLNSDVFIGGITFYQDFDIPSNNAYSVRKEDRKILRLNCNNKEKFKVGVVTDDAIIRYYCSAYKHKTLLFTQNFQYEGNVVYPHGSNVEVYVDDELTYTELEILGGMSSIMPGESKSIQMVWQLEIV